MKSLSGAIQSKVPICAYYLRNYQDPKSEWEWAHSSLWKSSRRLPQVLRDYALEGLRRPLEVQVNQSIRGLIQEVLEGVE